MVTVTFANGQWFTVQADTRDDAARIASREMPHAGEIVKVEAA